MTYKTFAEFERHFTAAQSAAHSYHNTSKALPNVSAADGWALYQNTKKASLKMQIFGRHIFDAEGAVKKFMQETPTGESRQMPAFMIGITNMELDNFGKTNSESSGSALLTGKDKWNFTMNDSWLLGGIHGRQEFHPASPVSHNNIFHNNFVLTITGRELLGLALAGYKEVMGHKTLGRMYRPGSDVKADELDLVSYQVEVSKLKSVDAAKKVFEKAGFEIL